MPFSGFQDKLNAYLDELSHGLGLPFFCFMTKWTITLIINPMTYSRYTVLWLYETIRLTRWAILWRRYTVFFIFGKVNADEQSHGLGIPFSGFYDKVNAYPDEQSHGLGIPFFYF